MARAKSGKDYWVCRDCAKGFWLPRQTEGRIVTRDRFEGICGENTVHIVDNLSAADRRRLDSWMAGVAEAKS